MSGASAGELGTVVSIRNLGKRYDISPETGGPLKTILAQTGRLFRGGPAPSTKRVIWALRQIDLDVPRGAVIGVIGRNGAGKTTLLRTIARITAPTEGRIEGHGRVFPMLEVGVSFHPDFTARENVYLNAAMFGVRRAEVRARIDEIIEFSGVGDRIDDRVRDLSRGLYVRLAFSAAIMMRPDLLLADEVLAVGDAEFHESCLARIRSEKKRGMSVLFVSHDMAAVKDVCESVVWIDNGRVRKIGDPESVVAAYEHDLWGAKTRQIGAQRDDLRPVLLLAARCLGKEGHEIAEIAQDDPLQIELVFQSSVAGAKVTPGVDLFAGPVLLFSSWRTEPFSLERTGVFAARLEIPPWCFTARDIRYKASLRVELSGGASYISDEAPEASFRLHGAQQWDPDGKLVKRQRAGFIVPRLEWTVEFGSAPSRASERIGNAQ